LLARNQFGCDLFRVLHVVLMTDGCLNQAESAQMPAATGRIP
jgi:hypothetical protein